MICKENKALVFDGVPRNMEQASYFEEALLEFGRKLDEVFLLTFPKRIKLKNF